MFNVNSVVIVYMVAISLLPTFIRKKYSVLCIIDKSNVEKKIMDSNRSQSQVEIPRSNIQGYV